MGSKADVPLEEKAAEVVEQQSSEEELLPPVVGAAPVKRGRGRPPGSPDKKKRVRRTREQIQADKVLGLLSVFLVNKPLLEQDMMWEFWDCEDVIDREITVMLTVREALAGGDSKQWSAALTKEEARLLSFGTFGEPLSDEQVKRLRKAGKQILPIAIILDRKR